MEFGPPPFFDVNGDHYITAGDVLVIFNYLNQQASGVGEAGTWLAASLPELPAAPNKKVADLSHQVIFSEESDFLTGLPANTPWQAILTAGDAATGEREEKEPIMEPWEPLEKALDSLFPPVL